MNRPQWPRIGFRGVGIRVAALLGLLTAGLIALPIGAAGASTAPIHVAVLNESTGEFGAQFRAVVPGATAWAKWENAHGGVDGHRIDLKIYNGASNRTTAVANAHRAVEHGAQAIIDTDPLFDSYAPYLHSQDIPVYAFGITPGFYKAGSDNNFFSYSGNIYTGHDIVPVKFLIQVEHKTKFAIISDSSPADSEASMRDIPLIKALGGDLVYTNLAVNPTSTNALLSVARAIKASGAQVVWSAVGGTEAQQQVDLAREGAGNVWVFNGSDYEQNLPQQFGRSLDNYTFYFFTAPFTANTPGIHDYLAAMKKYAPSSKYAFNALVGWASGELLAGGIGKLGSKAVTGANLTKATNKLKNYDGDGSFPPISFPFYHQESTRCLAFVQVRHGKWVRLSGNRSTPFYCAEPLA
jgi:branched-chain amino acid transport system substrate-binding protein